GEVGGTCWGWEVMKAQWVKALESGDVRVVIQAVPKAQHDLSNVAVALELAKSEEAKQLIQVGIHDQGAILRPFALPPSTPSDIVRTMRRAFQETMKDPTVPSGNETSQSKHRSAGGAGDRKSRRQHGQA